MIGTGWQRLDQLGRELLPGFFAAILVLVSVVPLPLPQYGQVATALTLIPVYYWSLERPNLFPPVLAFELGLLQDLLSGSAIGGTALIFVVVQWVVRSQRRFLIGQPFVLVWWGFLPVALLAAVAEWVLFCTLNLVITPIEPAIFRAGIAVALFPLFAAMMMWINRLTVSPDLP